MSMTDTVEGEPLKFILVDGTPAADIKYVVQTPSEEVKETWIKEIRSILDMQKDFLRGKSLLVPCKTIWERCIEVECPASSKKGKLL